MTLLFTVFPKQLIRAAVLSAILATRFLTPNSLMAAAANDAEFKAALALMDAAQLELQNGRPEPFKAAWSHAEDVTLSGGFGGTIEKGWAKIEQRLDWVAKQFSRGTNRIERVAAHCSGDLGYTVQLEHIRFVVPGEAKESIRDYRVTMIFRREAEGWRILHRQADSQMEKAAPR